MTEHTSGGRARPLALVATLLLLTVGAAVMLSASGGVLEAMHPAGCRAASVADLQPAPWRAVEAIDVARATESWHAHTLERHDPARVERLAPCASRLTDAVGGPSTPRGRFSAARDLYEEWLTWDMAILVPLQAAAALAVGWFARRRVPVAAIAAAVALGVGGAWIADLALRAVLTEAWAAAQVDGFVNPTTLDLGVVRAATWARWVGFGTAAAVLAVVLARPVLAELGRLARAWRGAVFPAVVAGGFGLAMVALPQAADAIRRWDARQVAATVTVVTVLSVLVAAGDVIVEARPAHRPATSRWGALPPAVVAVVLGAAAALGPIGLAVPALLAAGVAVASLAVAPGASLTSAEPADLAADRRHLRLALAAVMTAAVGLAMIRVGAADLAYLRPRSGRSYSLLVGGAGLVASAGWRAVGIRRADAALRAWTAGSGRRRGIVLGALAAASWPPALAMTDPDVALGAAGELGSVAVVGLFLVALFTVVLALRWACDAAASHERTARFALAPAFAALGFRRAPLAALLGVWLLATPAIPDADRYDVRRLEGEVAGTQALETSTIADAVDRWVGQQDLTGGAAVPAVAVAAAGGGIRAAYWTAAVLDCVVDGATLGDDPCAGRADPASAARRRDGLVLLSGVSGGAIGLTAYNTEVGPGWTAPGGALPPRWYDGRFDGDLQAPVLARLLFGDLPSMLLGAGSVDRAEVLERALEAEWPDGRLGAGFAASQRQGEPTTVLTGFSASSGCRVALSVLSTNADRGVDDCASFTDAPAGVLDATVDLGDLLCAGSDLRRSTVAVLSARFPYVSPAGRFASSSCHGRPHVTHVVDGGYQDASGASAVEELWPAFQQALVTHPAVVASGACIVPVAVQLDSTEAPSGGAGGDGPGEIVAPLSTFLTAQRSIEAAARIGLMATFTGPVVGPGGTGELVVPFPGIIGGEPQSRFVRIAPQARPGATAPLGWALSPAARADLQDQLVVNRAQIEHLRAVLDGDHLRCGAAPTGGASTSPPVGDDADGVPVRRDPAPVGRDAAAPVRPDVAAKERTPLGAGDETGG